MNRLSDFIRKLLRFFSIYPDGLTKQLLQSISRNSGTNSNPTRKELICIQNTPDKFFFLLFKLIRNEISKTSNIKVDLINVRSISASLGAGLLPSLKRSSIFCYIFLSQWERAWGDDKSGIAYRSVVFFQPLTKIKNWLRANALWLHLKNQTHPFSLVVDEIEIADLVIDSYLRFKPSPKFNPDDTFVKIIIWQAISDVNQARKYFQKKKPIIYLSPYSSYLEHGIPVRAALQQGVAVYTFGDHARFGNKLTIHRPYHAIDYSKFFEIFNQLENQADRLKDARAHLEVRLNGGIDPGIGYMKESVYKNSEFEIPKDFNDSVVIFLHEFYDNYNSYPNLIFSDFWSWICFTIETLCSKSINFYLKPHPNQLNQSPINDLKLKYPNLKWLSPYISNFKLVRLGMACGVTAYGTVAHELGYMGIPVICFGEHPHHSFNFCRTAKNRDEYKEMLETPNYSSLSKEEMQKESLAFYFMRNLYGSPGEISLKNAFINLWRECNVIEGSELDIINALNRLKTEKEFSNFIKKMMNKC